MIKARRGWMTAELNAYLNGLCVQKAIRFPDAQREMVFHATIGKQLIDNDIFKIIPKYIHDTKRRRGRH